MFYWPRVPGKNLGDYTDALIITVAKTAIDYELKGGGEPEGALSLGKDGCACARFGGKERDDGAQHLVGEVAQVVAARRMLLRFCLDPHVLVPRLDIHLSRRRYRQARRWGILGLEFSGGGGVVRQYWRG